MITGSCSKYARAKSRCSNACLQYVGKAITKGHIGYFVTMTTGVIQKVLPVLSTERLLHIWLSTEYYGFGPSSTAVDTGDTRDLMLSK